MSNLENEIHCGFSPKFPTSSAEERIHELNKSLQQRSHCNSHTWWDAFATEFFEDDATLTVTCRLEEYPTCYTITRPTIPCYFQRMFEGDVTDVYYKLKMPVETTYHQTFVKLECKQCTIIAHHGKPLDNKANEILEDEIPDELEKEQLIRDNSVVVYTEGQLTVEFSCDLLRIKSWHFSKRKQKELVPRSLVALEISSLLEPVHQLISQQKACILKPRNCLQTDMYKFFPDPSDSSEISFGSESAVSSVHTSELDESALDDENEPKEKMLPNEGEICTEEPTFMEVCTQAIKISADPSDSSEISFGSESAVSSVHTSELDESSLDDENEPKEKMLSNEADHYSEQTCKSMENFQDFPVFRDVNKNLKQECDNRKPCYITWTPKGDTAYLIYNQCLTHRKLGMKIQTLNADETVTGRFIQYLSRVQHTSCLDLIVTGCMALLLFLLCIFRE